MGDEWKKIHTEIPFPVYKKLKQEALDADTTFKNVVSNALTSYTADLNSYDFVVSGTTNLNTTNTLTR